jgi:lipooligosaccharide transport system permease protein
VLGAFYVAEFRYRSMIKWWGAILAYGLGNPVLYLVSVGLGIGALVDAGGNSDEALGGVGYLEFLAPALLAAAAIQAVLDEVTFPVMDGFVWEKLFFAFQNTSISPRQIADGVILIAMLRGLFTTVLYLGALVLFGAIPLASVFTLTLTSMFAAVAFATLMLALTASMKGDDGYFAIIGRFVIAPMFLFSGTFYPLELMPIGVQWIGWISPLWHATELGRFLSYGDPLGQGMFAIHIGYFAVLTAVGLALSYRQFRKRLSE